MVTQEQADGLLTEIRATTEAATGREEAVRAAMKLIARHLPHYNWVGVYVLQGGLLHLEYHVGADTEHTIIPIGHGICGTAIIERRNLIVEDVRTLTNYLACSVETRSEIVVLIRDANTGESLGLIDADSDEVGAFDATDEAFLEKAAALLATKWDLKAV